MSAFYAHSLGENRADWELLQQHATRVSKRAGENAKFFGLECLAAAAGLLHDVGKASKEFQDYIRGCRPEGGDHSTWGAREALRLYPQIGAIIAPCIAGHHAGLSDHADLLRRLDAARTVLPDATRWAALISVPMASSVRPSRRFPPPHPSRGCKAFSTAFMIRMLFSALVDADFVETEWFMTSGAVNRDIAIPIENLPARMQGRLQGLRLQAGNSRLNQIRTEILDHALAKATEPRGFFTFTVPTGGGKTISSLAFALSHAVHHDMRRIIYVAPFTAIIEQTADVFRHELGDAAVLEHHSTFDWEDAAKLLRRDGGDEIDGLGPLKLATENWNAPVVVTTAVQFFESLFACRTSRCRKLHNIADAVVILDEVQTLPTKLLLPCLEALEELRRNYGVSIVFCTATQPAIRRIDGPITTKGGKIDHALDICETRELAPRPRDIYEELRRVTVEVRSSDTADAVIAQRFVDRPRMLCIVNSRAHAFELFEAIAGLDGAVHLSTLMCPAHRREILAGLRRRLKEKLPVRLVATSLIEAGVDISFPEVWRAMAGLDQIAQAAGRCNREAELAPELGRVVVFQPEDHRPPWSMCASIDAARSALRDHGDDPLGLAAIKAYFRQLFFQKGEELDGALVGGHDLAANERPRGILNAIRANAKDVGFPFASIAEAFRMIETDMVPVVVPWNEDATTVLKRVEHMPKPTRADLRRLQNYVVVIPRDARGRWLVDNTIRPVRQDYGMSLLRFATADLYRPKTGIDLSGVVHRDAMHNVW